jgi:hypothetical protein
MIVVISFHLSGQEKIKLTSINMAGIVMGQNGNSSLVQTLNGITYKKSFTGVGVGIDYYKNKTIPLFADIRTSIAKTNFFFFADPGYNFPHKNKPDEKVSFYNTYHFSGGFYTELGIGYKMRLAQKSFLLFSSGYSYKEITNKTGVVSPCLAAPCPVDYTTYKYSYGRVLFKAGISL